MKYPVRILNELGYPVRGAKVSAKGYEGITDGNGYALITAPKFNPETLFITITHEKYVEVTVRYSEIKASAGTATIGAA